jgi:hypothetical protein
MATNYTTEELLNKESRVYSENPYFARPGESVDEYMTRTGANKPKEPTTPITLPEQPITQTPTTTDGLPTLQDLVTASKPSVDRTDLERQMREQFAGQRSAIEGRFGAKIGEFQEKAAQQERALGGQMGIGRRFSSSAQAFIKYIDTENQKVVNDLTRQKEEALASFDFELANMIEKRIANEVAQKQQDFENMITIMDYVEKQKQQQMQAKEPQIKSAREAAIADIINQGLDDPTKIQELINYDNEGNQIGDITLEEIDGVMGKIQTYNESLIGDIILGGITNTNDIYRYLRSKGKSVPLKQVANYVKELQTAEEVAPGIVGEWMSAKKNDPTLANYTLEDYLDLKDPKRLLALKETQLNIKKLEQEIATSGIDGTANEIMAYARQYASTGTIPTGMPKGTFGLVSEYAKDLPKKDGTIVDINTGVRSSALSQVEQQDFTTLYSILKNVEKLKALDEERTQGLLLGGAGYVFGDQKQSEYLAYRKMIVDDMARMQSGAALTEDEVKFYEEYLPGRYGEIAFVLGQDSAERIQTFQNLINKRMEDRMTANDLVMYGFSKVKIDGKDYTVGQQITNSKGQIGRVNSDGSITIIQ